MKTTHALLISLSLLIFIVPALGLHAQATDTTHSLRPGAYALQFQISDDFELESFNGSVISYKRQVTETRATRLGLTFNGVKRNQDFDSESSGGSDEQLIFNLGINYTWMYYINPEADIKFYYGYGPGVNIGYDKSESELENGGGNGVAKTTRIGVVGLGYVGVEWFFQKSMSIHAEYRASVHFSYLKTDIEAFNGPSIEENAKIFRLGGDGVLFGMSVYF